MIRPVCLDDADSLACIYNYYVTNTFISFEEAEIDSESMRSRIQKALQAGHTWLVQEDESKNILGYAYCAPWKERSAYRFSYEMTIYLSHSAQGKGVGSQLYQALLAAIKSKPIKTLLAIIALPNDASVALHEKIGMKKVAHFENVGYKFDRWVDVGYWQMNLAKTPTD